jgi:hypothetical protein
MTTVAHSSITAGSRIDTHRYSASLWSEAVEAPLIAIRLTPMNIDFVADAIE